LWNNVYSGDIIDSPSKLYSISILNPPLDAHHWSTNNSSIVMQISIPVSKHDSVSLLMTGDIERTAEYRMIENFLLTNIDLLKVSHHGSATSTTQAFLSATKPKDAVVSRGKWYASRNELSLNKVTKRLSVNGINHYITVDSGAILFESDFNNGNPKWNKIEWRNPSFAQWLFANNR
jgi:competence protein ComEC